MPAGSQRPAIEQALLRGKTPSDVSKIFNRATVYAAYNELVAKGLIKSPSQEDEDSDTQPEDINSIGDDPKEQTRISARAKSTDTVNFGGAQTLPPDVAERIRGVLGISARPKVLSMVMPELLYPAMVIATTELDFPVMRPEDFIDTVLYQWLEGSGYIPRAYIKRSDLDKLVEKPSKDEADRQSAEWAKQHGLMTVTEFIQIMSDKLGIPELDVADILIDGHDGQSSDNHNGHEHSALQPYDTSHKKDEVVVQQITHDTPKVEQLAQEMASSIPSSGEQPEREKQDTKTVPDKKPISMREVLSDRYKLDEQESRTIELLVAGNKMNQIALAINIEPKLMMGYFSTIFWKMGVKNGIYAVDLYNRLKYETEGGQK